jgi:hypothetical protein
LPYGLDIVENLANQVLPKLSEMLEAELTGNVKALLIFNFFMCALLYIIFRQTTVGRYKDTKMGIDAASKVSDDQGATVAS